MFQTWQLWNDSKGLDLIDKSLADSGSCSQSEVMRCIQIGLLCVQDHAADRPTMLDVVLMLSCENNIPQPKEPRFRIQSPGRNKAYTVNEVTVSVLEGR